MVKNSATGTGDAGGQAVDAVGQVHSVDSAHNDKGRKNQVHQPVQRPSATLKKGIYSWVVSRPS